MAFTRVLGPGIHTASNINSHNINSTGIITAVSFVGNGAGLTGIASTDNIITGTAATFNTYPVDINAGMDVVGVSTFAGITTVTGNTLFTKQFNVSGISTFNEDLFISGTKKLEFGGTGPGSSFLQIHHNGSNSIIEESGPGGVQIHAGNFLLMNDAGTEKIIRAFKNGDVELYFDNSE